MTRALRVVPAVFVLVLAQATPASAQQLHSALVPDTVAVGDMFHIALRVDVPAGHVAEFPDSILVEGDLESGGRVRRSVEPLADGAERIRVAYPLTAWRPGSFAVPSVSVSVRGPDGRRTLRAELPAVEVLSVLPADTAGIAPQPAKDVFGPDRVFWPFLLGLVALLAVAAVLGYWLRTRAKPVVAPLVAVSARERALQELQRAYELGLIESDELKLFYSLVSEALRHYLEALRPDWGADLTTSELLPRTSGAVPEPEALTLARTLQSADLVKFARYRPTDDEARATWLSAKQWVESYEWRDPAEQALAERAEAETETEPVGEPATAASTAAVGRTEVA